MAMKVSVQHRRQRHDLEAPEGCTVGEFKERLAGLTGVRPEHQRLSSHPRATFHPPTALLRDVGLTDGAKVLVFGATEAEVRHQQECPRPSPHDSASDGEDRLLMCSVPGGRFYCCSAPLGPVKQQLYRCLTCAVDQTPAAVCLGCLKICHAGHEVMELYGRRGFQCDCGTPRLNRSCRFDPGEGRAAHLANPYDRAFENRYCHCGGPAAGRAVTPGSGDDMVQCWACEDWFHFRCTGLATQAFTAQHGDDIEPLFLCRRCVGRHPFLLHPGQCASAPVSTSVPPPPAPPADRDTLLLCPTDFEWCGCDACLLLYEQHNLPFLFKKDLDVDRTTECLPFFGDDDDEEEEDEQTGDEAVSGTPVASASGGLLPPEMSARILALPPAARLHVASAFHMLTEEIKALFEGLAGNVLTVKDAEDFANRLKRRREEGDGEGQD